MVIVKSRDLPLSELYSNLQLEYLSYYVRSKTYCKEFVDNYSKICCSKRDKIEKISSKNNLPSIFNDDHAKQRYIDKFLNEQGIPNFTYKDDEIKDRMSCWDRYYFFQKGCSVKFKDGVDVLLGKVINNDKNSSIVYIIDENKTERELHYNNVSRLFPESFFNF